MAIEKNASAAQSRAVSTASGLGVTGTSTNTPSCSGTPASATMVVSYTFDFLGVTIPMSGKAVMRCGG